MNLPESGSNKDLSPEDMLALELLEKARKRRSLDIEEAARRARLPDDRSERDSSYSGILAIEVIAFHKTMMRLNRRFSIKNALGFAAIGVERGTVTHYPRSVWGNNDYKVSTPLLLSTPMEQVGGVTGAQVSDGYAFSTQHMRGPKKIYGNNPTVVIDRVVYDQDTRETVTRFYEYIIHTYARDEGHPFALVRGSGMGPVDESSAGSNDPRLLQPLGLLRLANEAIA